MSSMFLFGKKEQERNNGITYISPQLFVGFLPHPYKDVVCPDLFLNFCIEDIKHNDMRSLTNAFSNCKKAIQIRIDLILNQYGLLAKNMKCDFPTKLELIQDVGLLPTLMLKNINDERNLIEHDYQIPNEKRTREVIDVAELLYMASENILSRSPVEVIIGFDTEPLHSLMKLEPEKGQLLFYAIENTEDNVFGLNEKFNVRYVSERYRKFDGTISQSLIISTEPYKCVELSYCNKSEWIHIISSLCFFSKNDGFQKAGMITNINDEASISCIVEIPVGMTKESFSNLLTKNFNKRKSQTTQSSL